MNSVIAGRLTDDRQESAADVEEDITAVVRGEAASGQPSQPELRGEMIATEVNSFIERVSVTSAKEIAKQIAELHSLRDLLQNEGQRVQDEVGGYLRFNEGTVKATRMISEAIPQLMNRK
jgi:hypothetical protein